MVAKALSIRQPWASLIIWGLKTVEIRSWSTNYRGLLFIHASKKVDEEAMKRFQVVEPLPVGSIIGFVELVNVEPFSETTWNELADVHMDIGLFSPDLYAWFMTNPRPLARPFLYRGDRGLFTVTIEDLKTS